MKAFSMDIPPAPGNPRNSEGAFIQRKNGSLMFVYSQFVGDSCKDHAAADLACIVSNDLGESWSAPKTLFTAKEHGAMNMMSVSLIRMNNGDIGLFYMLRMNWHDMRPVLRRSADEGESWSEPVCCVPRLGYMVLNNDRVIRLKSGRILLAVAQHAMTPGTDGGAFTHPGVVHTFFSDDDGVNWQEGRVPLSLNVSVSESGLQEPGLMEHENGTITMWARTDLGRQYECLSVDGGESWTPPAPSCFTSPCAPLSMKRLSDGRLFAVWNPIPSYQTRQCAPGTWGRTPLVYALSKDDGHSWSEPVVLENEEDCGYCYTAVYEVEGCLLLAYCAGKSAEDGCCLNRLRVRKIIIGE